VGSGKFIEFGNALLKPQSVRVPASSDVAARSFGNRRDGLALSVGRMSVIASLPSACREDRMPVESTYGGDSRSDVAQVVQGGRPVDMVDLDGVELVSEHSRSVWQLGFHDTLQHVLFGFVSASDLDAVGFLGVFITARQRQLDWPCSALSPRSCREWP